MAEEFDRSNALLAGPNKAEFAFYSDVLPGSRKAAFDIAAAIDGLEGEIALMRTEIRSLVTQDPDNIKEVRNSVLALDRLVRTRYNITKDDKNGLKGIIATVLKDIPIPAGLIGAGIKK